MPAALQNSNRQKAGRCALSVDYRRAKPLHSRHGGHMDLSEELIDHMDTFGERTIHGAFCSLINWTAKTANRLGGEHSEAVIEVARAWWNGHQPTVEDTGTAMREAWLRLGWTIGSATMANLKPPEAGK